MPVFVEDPAQLSISRLKSDLIAHNVALPPAKSKKEVYVELHLKHVDQKHAGDFSSDEEEDPALEVEGEEEDEEDNDVAENGEMPDPSALTDDDLKAALLERGVKAGPVVASTRGVYEKKLRMLLESDRREKVNGIGNAALYSDSEEEDEEEAADEEGSKRATPDSPEQSEAARQPDGQLENDTRAKHIVMESRRSRSASADGEPGGGDGPGRRSRSSGLEIPAAKQSPYYTPRASLYEWEKKDPADDAFKDLVPDLKTTPTGIYATRRRPIKGAAGRPVQYLYPDTPLSPNTLERREVDRRVLPVKMQILVFVVLALILFLIYACMDVDSPCLAVLDTLGQWAEDAGRLLLPDETQDKPALSGQE